MKLYKRRKIHNLKCLNIKSYLAQNLKQNLNMMFINSSKIYIQSNTQNIKINQTHLEPYWKIQSGQSLL